MNYHKIPKISRGAYIFQSLFRGAYIWRGLCTEGNLCFKIVWASLLLEGNVPFLLCFTLYLRSNSMSKPTGGYIWRGNLMEGFLHYKVVGGGGGAYIWRGLFSEFYSMCKNAPETELWIKENSNFEENEISSKLSHRKAHIKTRCYLGDLVTCAGDQEIGVISGRLPNNPGELACMLHVIKVSSHPGSQDLSWVRGHGSKVSQQWPTLSTTTVQLVQTLNSVWLSYRVTEELRLSRASTSVIFAHVKTLECSGPIKANCRIRNMQPTL